MNIIQGFPNPPQNYYKVYVQSCTFNQSPYIEDCLNGVHLQETNFPFVHQVIDDASTDGEQEIIKAWMERMCDLENAENYDNDICTIIVAKNLKNPNYTIAAYFLKTNLYTKQAKKRELYAPWQEVCPYEAMCEGDDFWIDSCKLQKQIDFLDSHPDYSMCFHRATILKNVDDECKLLCQHIKDKDYTSYDVLHDWIVPTASMLMRINVVNVPIKHREKILNGDIVLVLSSLTIGKIRGMSDEMSVYRMQPGGVSYDKRTLVKRSIKYVDHYKALRENFPFIDKNLINNFIRYAYWKRYKYGTGIQKYIDLVRWKLNII